MDLPGSTPASGYHTAIIVLAYHHMFYVIWAHPSTQRHGSKRWLQTIHVEQEWAIITLNERCHSATPAKAKPYLISHTEYKLNTQASLANHFSLSFPTNSPTLCYLQLKLGFWFVTWSLWTFCKTHWRQKDLPTHMRVSHCRTGPMAGRDAGAGKLQVPLRFASATFQVDLVC